MDFPVVIEILHKYVKRGIEQISLLEEALEETSQDTNQDE